MAAIEAANLTRTFHVGDEPVHALDGVDLSLSEGELAAVVGPSGSGKSTLLALLGGLDTPTSGSISVGTGHSTNGKAGSIRVTVGAGNTGDGGGVWIFAGQTTADDKVGGMVSIRGGISYTGTTLAKGGSVEIGGGAGSGHSGGAVSVLTGYGSMTSSGSVSVRTMNSGDNGVSGRLSFSAGTASFGNSGSISVGTGLSLIHI